MATRTLASMPGLAGLYARALAGGVPLVGRALGLAQDRAGELPRLRVDDIAVDPGHLAAYRALCGFARSDRLPATYPQAVAFPLALALLTDPAFPFQAMGTMHIGNVIACRRPLSVADRLAYEVAAGAPSAHRRGRSIVVEIAASAAGERVWRAEMELLRRGPTTAALPDDGARLAPDLPEESPSGPAQWRLAADLGRRYAAISGDRNPIHLYDLAAKPFGFSRHIAHGMWTHARALAELENRLPEAYDVGVAFKKPITLPGTVSFGARTLDDRIDFGVAAPTGEPHLIGRVRPR